MNNVIERIMGESRDYITVSPEEFKKGHGGSLSVKVVLPCYCQANCSFCFNKLTIETQKHDYDQFFANLPETLDMIFDNVNQRLITLDITGNEPTFDVDVFSRFMNIIEKYKTKIEKIVLTTNGYNLEKCIVSMNGIVDIVNISVHHYDYNQRQNIFKTLYIPSDEELKRIIGKLKENNITCTSVAVLYKKIEDFNEFYKNFMMWSMNLGFKDSRMRSNFCTRDEFIDEIFYAKTKYEKINEGTALTTKLIIDENTGFETYILKGVPDLTEYGIGVELVIDDNGLCYIDYNKRYPVDSSNIKYFNNLYIFNNGMDKCNETEEQGTVFQKIRK